MIDITVLRAMAAAGASLDVILTVIEADQKVHTDALTKRRISDANRQRKVRWNNVTSRESRDSLTALTAETVPPPISEERKKEDKKGRKHAIPKDWGPLPCEETKDWPQGRIEKEASRFRNNALQRGATYVDWQAAWRNWCSSPYQQKGHVNGNGNGHMGAPPRPHSREDRIERTNAAWEKLIHAAEQGDLLDPATPLGLPKPEGRT
jgi:hypothetical protein